MMFSSGHWNPAGGNVISQVCIDRMFARNIPAGAAAHCLELAFLDQALAYYLKQGKITVVNE